jgi:dipeptidyl aminopeptidase/acylaminoacyl peptidase
MRTGSTLFIVALAACAGSPAPRASSAAAPAPTATSGARHAPRAPVPLAEYFKVRRVGSRSGILLSFSHDEKLVGYLSDEAGRVDLWVRPIAGGPPRQITHVKGFIQGFAFSPTADQLLFASDLGGDEMPRLYLTDSNGAAPREVTPNYPPDRRADLIDWADDGKSFLFVSSLRDPKYLDLYEYGLATGRAERLWDGSGNLELADVSRDHRRFIIIQHISDADSNLYLVERGKPAKPKLLTPHKGTVLYNSHGLSRDGKTLYYTSDEGGEFSALYQMNLARGTSTALAKSDWDVEDGGFSRGWKYFYTVANVDGQFQLTITDARHEKTIVLPAPPPGGAWVPITSSRTDRYLGVRLQGDGAPATPYIIDMQAKTATPVLEMLPESLRARKMAIGEVVHVPSFDGRKVPGFLYRAEGSGPFPAIIDVHGGPTAQSQREFSAMRQYLISKGYVILVPNVRGSTGYGKTYTRLDNLDLGGGPLQDVVACKQWLVKEAHVDANRVVVMGGSYGGYMALAAATFTPNQFAALVDYFGVSDLKSLVESFPPYWAVAATFIYQKFGDPKNPAHAQYQHDRSPIHFVDRITRPLLVVQGDRDARVKQDQSDRIVAALERRHVPVYYLVLKDEGHGFSKTQNVVTASEATDRFLDRHIFGDTSVQVLPPR